MAELRPGATVGRFRLEREVARGGMGAVWAARDPRAPGRLVAVKTVIAAKSSKKLSQLFVEEARIARAVRHPNLVEMYDAGEEGGVPYLAMEWVEGLTLRALATSEGTLPLGVVLRICMEACDGLHAVHEARTDEGEPLHIVHRDVSPHNLLVSIAGRVKVIDFGIAKARGRLASETTDGVLRGKVRYMSPEHARGLPLDRRADIWSLGVTLLEVTTGAIPYPAEHDVAALVQLLSAEPTVPEDPRLPPAVRRVVERALRRKPEERYPNARAMGTDLEAAIASLGEKVTRRDVAHCVRIRIETARTQAIRIPNLDPDEDSDDGAATALFVSPKGRSEGSTKPEAPVPPRPAVPSEVSISERQTAPRLAGHEELSEEDLTSIRSVDIVVPASLALPKLRPILPSTPGALRLFAEMDAAAAKTIDAETTAPMPSSTPAPESRPRTAAPESAEGSNPEAGEPPATTQPKVPPPASSPALETPSRPPRDHRRLVSVLALSLVVFFLGIAGLLISQARDEPTPSSEAKPTSTPDPLGSSAIAIGAVRTSAPGPDAATSAKPKK